MVAKTPTEPRGAIATRGHLVREAAAVSAAGPWWVAIARRTARIA